MIRLRAPLSNPTYVVVWNLTLPTHASSFADPSSTMPLRALDGVLATSAIAFLFNFIAVLPPVAWSTLAFSIFGTKIEQSYSTSTVRTGDDDKSLNDAADWDSINDDEVASIPSVAGAAIAFLTFSIIATFAGAVYTFSAERQGCVPARMYKLEMGLAASYIILGFVDLILAGLWTRNFNTLFDLYGSAIDDEGTTACGAGCALTFLSSILQMVAGAGWCFIANKDKAAAGTANPAGGAPEVALDDAAEGAEKA